MKTLINQFLNYLEVERGLSPRTIKAYNYDLFRFYKFLTSCKKDDIELIHKQDIRDLLNYLANHENFEVSRARQLSAIKSFFKYLVKEDIIKVNPAIDIESPKIPQKEPSFLSEEEYNRLLTTIKKVATPYYKKRDIAIVSLFLSAGLRLSELVNLKLEDVDLKQNSIKIKRKGNKEQIIPLNTEISEILKQYLNSRPKIENDSFFISKRENGISARSVYHLVKKYLKKAGINKRKVGVHSLRHTFCTALLNKGVNLIVIQQLAGHRNLETTRKYLHLNNIDLRNAVNQISFK